MLQVTEELRVVEEILLLVLDTDSGEIRHTLPLRSRAVAFAGAALMDLALEERIDTDLEHLLVSDQTPLGNDLLDPILAEISRSGENPRDTASWITDLAERSDEIREKALAWLIERGVLEAAPGGEVFLSPGVSRARHYRTADGRTTEEVQLRIMRALFSDDIPDPRDVVIVSLASACGVFESILSPDELAQVRERIDLICRLDLIGREVAAAIRQVEALPLPVPSAVRPAAEIPEAAGLPLLGNAFGMAGDIREFLAREYRNHGPIFRVRALHHRFIAMVGPEANVFLAQISATHLRSYEPYRELSAAIGTHRSLLNMDGPEHLHMRKLQVKGYSPKTFEANLDLVQDATRRLIEAWPQEQPIEIRRAMQEIIAEQIGLCCTGISPQAYIDDLTYFLETVIMVHVTGRSPKLVKLLPKFRRSERRIGDLSERILEAHQPERRGGYEPDFVDDLLEMNRTDPQFLPETDLRANVIAPFLVGLDTSASVCAFMLYALLTRPDLWERMQAEVDAMYEQGPPTPEALSKLDVTRRVTLESLRMYPIIPVLLRTVSNSFEFRGYRVPAGTQLLIGTTVGHHLPEYFPNPEVFDIERYSPGEAQHSQPGAFAPFGVGRHRCLGSGLSEVQIALTMATIVRETELALDRPERPLKIRFVPTPHPDDSVRFRVARRRRR